MKQPEGEIITKIKNGLPKFDQEFHEKLLKDGWKELKEPVKSLMGYVALSVPFMIVNFLIGMWIMIISTSGIATDQKNMTIYVIDDAPVIILAAIVSLVVHELIHLLFIPNFKSDNTYIGFTYFGGYVYTKEALTKYRLCLIYIAPFVFLSIIFNAISGSLGFYNVPLSAFIILNSIGSSVDILSLTLVLLQVPKDAYLIMNGMRTYWKHHR